MRRFVLLAAVTAAVLLPAGSLFAESTADNDKAMSQQIGLQIKDSGQLHNYRIGVKYQDGVAWLNGSVASAEQREAALQLARGMEGVEHVVCKLEIAQPPASQPAPPAAQVATGDPVDTAEYTNDKPSNVLSTAAISYGKMQAKKKANIARMRSQNTPRVASNRSRASQNNMPMPLERIAAQPTSAPGPRPAGHYMGGAPAPQMNQMGQMNRMNQMNMGPQPMAHVPGGQARAVSYDNAQMPGYAWPSYASYPNYAALTYPRQYSPAAWPYIGPFYPYPQVPLGWRKVSLEWDDGWWFLDFSSCSSSH